jgi:peptidoglycan/LPS O-acetylase OafA/YrhL
VRRCAAGVSLAGLVVMIGVVIILARTSTFTVESRVALYLFGLALFIIGGSLAQAGLRGQRE